MTIEPIEQKVNNNLLNKRKILLLAVICLILLFAVISWVIFQNINANQSKLTCSIDNSSYSYDIVGETGEAISSMKHDTISFQYDTNGNRLPYTQNIHGTVTYKNGHVYNLTIKIYIDEINNKSTLDINATGGLFGTNTKSCHANT